MINDLFPGLAYLTMVPVRLQRVLLKKSKGLLKGWVSSYDQ